MVSPAGTQVDINIIEKRLGRLKRFIQNNQTATFKALSTTILGDITSLDTLIQAASSNHDLSSSPTIDLHDDPDQTADS